MKRTISIIYRICYIFFSCWTFGLLFIPIANAHFNPFLSFPSFVNILGLICIIPVLIMTIKKRPGKGLIKFKALCAFLSLVTLICNMDILTLPGASDWIICILLPAMMFLDWLIFDKKGTLNGIDPLMWLGILALLGLLLFTLLKNILELPNVLDLWGLFKNKDELISLAVKSIIGAGIMYLLDNLLSGKSGKALANKIAFFWRLLFVCLEGWALFTLSGKTLSVFIRALESFTVTANFLCFLCILSILVYNLIKNGSIFKQNSPFPIIKGIFTFSIIIAFVMFYFGGGRKTSEGSDWVFALVGPFMMFLDWLLFDEKGKFKVYEPLLWLIIPAVHLLIVLTVKGYAAFSLKNFILFIVLGYILFVIDKILAKK